jgi:hypothetical protein
MEILTFIIIDPSFVAKLAPTVFIVNSWTILWKPNQVGHLTKQAGTFSLLRLAL